MPEHVGEQCFSHWQIAKALTDEQLAGEQKTRTILDLKKCLTLKITVAESAVTRVR